MTAELVRVAQEAKVLIKTSCPVDAKAAAGWRRNGVPGEWAVDQR